MKLDMHAFFQLHHFKSINSSQSMVSKFSENDYTYTDKFYKTCLPHNLRIAKFNSVTLDGVTELVDSNVISILA